MLKKVIKKRSLRSKPTSDSQNLHCQFLEINTRQNSIQFTCSLLSWEISSFIVNMNAELTLLSYKICTGNFFTL